MHPFIEAEKQAGHNVKRACELLKVSRAAFYTRRTAAPGPRAVRDAEPTEKITEVHATSRGANGAPRVHAVLQRDGDRCGRRRVTPDAPGRPRQSRASSPDRERPGPVSDLTAVCSGSDTCGGWVGR
ncbi:IS3 family transposase [Kitasatospora sp. NPDC047058]|uniref:IS3 family transposase n=1 Tax=Kitasatospora sp. NPDC047058 TaxID=3155620 RepID=UPI0034105EB8